MSDVIEISTISSEAVEIIEQGPQGPPGVGVPTGGVTGYVLAKKTGDDYDTEWIFNAGGGGADLSNPPPIGDVTPNTGDFTTLTAVTGYFTTISASGTATLPHIHGSIAGNLYIHVKNTDATALSRGTPVYIVGNVGDTDRVEVAAADFDDAAKMPAIGLLEQDLEVNGQGDAVIVGELDAANTAAFALNQEVFVGNAGTITGTRPVTGQVQSVGTIARVQSETGVIVVNMQARRSPDESFAAASHTHVSADITDATSAATTDVIVKRDANGSAALQELVVNVPTGSGKIQYQVSGYNNGNLSFDSDGENMTFSAGNQGGPFLDGAVMSFGRDGISFTGSNVATQQSNTRTALGLGTAATSATSDFAAASHTHVSADITDATNSATANTIVKRDASGGASFGGDVYTNELYVDGSFWPFNTFPSDVPVKMDSIGALGVGAFGSNAGEFCEGNDARLSDARTPTSHAPSHATAGSDPLAPSDIGAAAASHTHAASAITSGTLTHERGGLEADVSAYDGLLKISGGSTSQVSIGTGANDVASGDHTHTQLHDRSHAFTSTSDHTAGNHKVFYSNGSGEVVELALGDSGKVLQSNGATSAPTWETPAALPIEFVVACSDETTDLTTGTAKVTFRAPVAFLLTGVAASVNTAPTGSTLIVDINNGANSALSTKLSIDASEKTSATAATAAVIDTTYDDFAVDAEITIDIDQIGSTVAGAGLKVILKGTRA